MWLLLVLIFALSICRFTESQDSKLDILLEDTEDEHGVKAASSKINDMLSESMFYREFYQSIHDGNAVTVKELLDLDTFRTRAINSFFDIDRQGNFMGKPMKSALHIACEANQVEMAELLMERGASLELKDDTLFTPLMVATSSGYTKLSRVLMEAGANVNATGHKGISSLLMATKGQFKEIVEDLIYHGVNVNALNEQNFSALMIASGAGRLDLVKILFEAGADVNIKETSNNTALSWAIFQTQEAVVQFLLENGASQSIPQMNSYGMKCIHLATVKNSTSILQMLLDYGANISDLNKDGRTALHFAAEIKHLEVVAQFLIVKGIDIDFIWEKGIEKIPYSAHAVAKANGNDKVVKLIDDRVESLKTRKREKNVEL